MLKPVEKEHFDISAACGYKTSGSVQPGFNFTNVFAHVFRVRFLYKRLFSSYVLVMSKKSTRKMREKTLVKLTTGFNFTNILLAAFAHTTHTNSSFGDN